MGDVSACRGKQEFTIVNRLRHSVLASVCVLICLSPRVFSQSASRGPTPKPGSEVDNRPITLTLDSASYTTLIGGR